MATPQEVKVRRIYEAPLELDGTRILVDRLWPRGLGTEKPTSTDDAKSPPRRRRCAGGTTMTLVLSKSSAGATALNWKHLKRPQPLTGFGRWPGRDR